MQQRRPFVPLKRVMAPNDQSDPDTLTFHLPFKRIGRMSEKENVNETK